MIVNSSQPLIPKSLNTTFDGYDSTPALAYKLPNNYVSASLDFEQYVTGGTNSKH